MLVQRNISVLCLFGKLKNYIKVKNYKPAIKTTEYDDVLHCLVTTNHNIPVGEYTFWDWED